MSAGTTGTHDFTRDFFRSPRDCQLCDEPPSRYPCEAKPHRSVGGPEECGLPAVPGSLDDLTARGVRVEYTAHDATTGTVRGPSGIVLGAGRFRAKWNGVAFMVEEDRVEIASCEKLADAERIADAMNAASPR